MKHELITLPYDADALSPVISAQTLAFHHGKHLQAYVNNLNNLIVDTAFADSSLEDIIRKADGGIFNNAAQIMNHNLYFLQFSPSPKKEPEGKLKQAIECRWGSLEAFKEEFVTAASTLFGSGWAWLAADTEGNLEILKEENAGNPLTKNKIPLMCFDVWEHAYYLDYQNRRPDHLNDLWTVLDWAEIERRYR